MIIFISSLLYTIELVLQHGNCLNLIDLQQGGVGHSPKWKLESRRAPAMYERVMAYTLPRRREIKSNFRRYWHGYKKPHNKIFFKASRRVEEDERDANLKNKLASLVKQLMLGTEDLMKEIEGIKQAHREQEAYKAGFVLSMLKKSRDVVNELFNVAIKHRDEWQALEQLKIFEIIVHTNIDTTNLLKQLIDIQSGREVTLEPPVTKSPDEKDTDVTKETGVTENNEAPKETEVTKETGVTEKTEAPKETEVTKETGVTEKTAVPKETEATKETEVPKETEVTKASTKEDDRDDSKEDTFLRLGFQSQY